MKQVLFKLKRRVVLFKETAQMILNQAELCRRQKALAGFVVGGNGYGLCR